MTQYVEIEGEVLRTTDNALLFNVDDDVEVWIPLSQIENNGECFEDGSQLTIYVSEWFAEKENLV